MPPASTIQDAGPRYPHVRVKMSEPDGNLFCVLDRVDAALKAGGVRGGTTQSRQTGALRTGFATR